MNSARLHATSKTSANLARTPNQRVHAVEVLPELNAELENVWHEIRDTRPELRSGFYDPDFSKAVNRVRGDVHYLVLYGHAEVLGILPFQRPKPSLAQPVGGMLNDYHGLILRRGVQCDIGEWLPSAGLRHFRFHALQDFSKAKSPSHCKQVFETLRATSVDLSQGHHGYRNWLFQHSSTVRRQGQKARALARKLGPLSLEVDCRDRDAVEYLIEMKRAKYQRTRTFDILGLSWTQDVLREIFDLRTANFLGMLSVLRAGDTIVSGHFGFLANGILHYWFPAHEHAFGKFSPGTQLMLELTKEPEEPIFQRIDLGYGDSDLKDRFANAESSVEIGCYDPNAIARNVAERKYFFRQSLKKIPAKKQVKKFLRPLWPNLGKGQFP